MRQGRERKEINMTDHFYVLVCKACDDDQPMPFESPEERGHWASQHTQATGHDDWYVADHGAPAPVTAMAVPDQQIPPGGAPVVWDDADPSAG